MAEPQKPEESSIHLTLVLDRRWLLWEVLACLILLTLIFWGIFRFRGNEVPMNLFPLGSAASTEKPGWRLTFADEFDGNTLDTSKWIDSYPHGRRTHYNNELEYYAPDGWKVGGGNIRFAAEKRSMGGKNYTSGMISSYGKFRQKYGWFEMRARLPKGQGVWPAFWLLPDTNKWPPEIDIMEVVGHEPNVILMTTHWGQDFQSRRLHTEKWTGPDFSADFHTFALEWNPKEIIWYVDGTERHRFNKHIPQEPFYVIANLAIGGDLPGMPDETTPFPSEMDIDYIRVYEKAE